MMELNIRKSVLVAATLPMWPYWKFHNKFSSKIQFFFLGFLCYIVTKPLVTTLLALIGICLISAAVLPSMLLFIVVFVGITAIVIVKGLVIFITAIVLLWGIINIITLYSIIVNTKYF